MELACCVKCVEKRLGVVRGKMGKILETIIIGVFIGVIVFIFSSVLDYPIGDFFSSPEVITIAQYDEEVCPTNILFNYDKTADFSIQLKNNGDDGSLYLVLLSDQVLSKTYNDNNFQPNSTKSWVVDNKQIQNFNFKLKQKDEGSKDFRMNLRFGCLDFFCKEKTLCCNYKKAEYSDMYNLNNKTC